MSQEELLDSHIPVSPEGENKSEDGICMPKGREDYYTYAPSISRETRERLEKLVREF